MILAGGFGTRLSEETNLMPKPLVEVGGLPIIWHVMKLYSSYGYNDFIVCGGYKVEELKRYFCDYFMLNSDIEVDLSNGEIRYISKPQIDWKVKVVDTGIETMTGGRLKRVIDLISKPTFLMTYGDGIADINLNKLVTFHKQHGKKATITSVRPPGRFGVLTLDNDKVKTFEEKPHGKGGWINGGFFVLERSAVEFVSGDGTIWEQEPLKQLAQDNELMAFRHDGFWQPMDTLRDKNYLNKLWENGAPWKCW